MSTSYYTLKPPVTSVRLDPEAGGAHTGIRVWVNHAKAGELTLRNEEAGDFLNLLKGEGPVAQHHWGGDAAGCVVTWFQQLPDETQVVSDRGELTTACEVRALHGKNRKP